MQQDVLLRNKRIKENTMKSTCEDKSITKEITILEEVALEKMNLKQLKTKDSKLFMINNFRDEKLIFNTFKSDEDEDVRLEVVKKLSDENLIFYFKDDDDLDVRKEVIKKLSDENLIYSFKDDEYWWIRKAVINKLSDENLIFDTFKDDKDSWVREAVVKELSDKRLSP